MHPAPSVIIFTVLSGAGFGYLAFLGLGLSLGTGFTAFWQFALAFSMTVGGLISSTFHLGNPQRALLAFTQWRTSWLSREAWAAVVTLLIAGFYAIGVIFFATRITPLGWLVAAMCIATVFVTSMIYAQMATVPRWNTVLTPIYFVAAALAAGAMLAGQGAMAILLLLVLTLIQIACWLRGDRRFAERGHSIASATGLGTPGRIRLFEAPHSGSNYLLKEFGFQVARRHAVKLKVICIATLGMIPVLLIFLGGGIGSLILAFAFHLVGICVSRWLFFAEAEHVVQLYYGNAPAPLGA